MTPVNCKMIKFDVKLSYTTVATGITCQLGLFPEGVEAAAPGHAPTTMPGKQQMLGRVFELISGHTERKKFW